MTAIYRSCQIACALGMITGYITVRAAALGVETAGRQLVRVTS